jgi:hypothetical protein
MTIATKKRVVNRKKRVVNRKKAVIVRQKPKMNRYEVEARLEETNFDKLNMKKVLQEKQDAKLRGNMNSLKSLELARRLEGVKENSNMKKRVVFGASVNLPLHVNQEMKPGNHQWIEEMQRITRTDNERILKKGIKQIQDDAVSEITYTNPSIASIMQDYFKLAKLEAEEALASLDENYLIINSLVFTLIGLILAYLLGAKVAYPMVQYMADIIPKIATHIPNPGLRISAMFSNAISLLRPIITSIKNYQFISPSENTTYLSDIAGYVTRAAAQLRPNEPVIENEEVIENEPDMRKRSKYVSRAEKMKQNESLINYSFFDKLRKILADLGLVEYLYNT